MPSAKDIRLFGILKREIVDIMKKSHPGISDDIGAWKGQEIINFQEDLMVKVHEHISEKWFYLHMKSDNDRLPRIDILDLMSRYAGYTDWNDFRYQHQDKILAEKHPDWSNRFFILVLLLLILLSGAIFAIIKLGTRREYSFCFINQLTRQPITDSPISIWLLEDNESPEYISCDSNGCFSIKTSKPEIRYIVKSPYYHTDTLTRFLNRTRKHETVNLKTNDYALMLNYLSNARVVDWKARRTQLDNIIKDDAMIYQVFMEEKLGMELYNKWEFINKISLPSKSMRNLEIIEMTFDDAQISELWFKQMIGEHE